MDRRSLIKNAGLAGVLAAGVAPAVHAQAAVRWRMATSFPKSLETLHGAGVKFAETVKALSGGKFEVSVHAAGELMPAFGIVDALSEDTIEMGLTAAYYYTGKDPAFAFSCAVPFGLTAGQNQAWKEHGNGRKLLNELFAKYNFQTLSALNTGTQMGGWYRKEIKSPADFKGLKMRLGGGVFGESMAKLGVVAQNMPVGEVYQALEKGTLDAVEFVGPYDDEKLGYNKVAKYYYYPGFWEGGPQISLYVNQKNWAALPKEYQTILEDACLYAHAEMQARYDAKNPTALKQLVGSGTQLRPFPNEVMAAAFKAANELYEETAASNPKFKKIYEAWKKFRDEQLQWFAVAENRFDNFMQAARSASAKAKK